MLTLFGCLVVRSNPATGARPLSPSARAVSPRYRPVAGSRRSLIRLRTVLLDAVVPGVPPSRRAADPIHTPGGLPLAV